MSSFRGWSRAPVDYHAYHMDQVMHAFRDRYHATKAALDPVCVVAPGRYAITWLHARQWARAGSARRRWARKSTTARTRAEV